MDYLELHYLISKYLDNFLNNSMLFSSNLGSLWSKNILFWLQYFKNLLKLAYGPDLVTLSEFSLYTWKESIFAEEECTISVNYYKGSW